MKTVIEMAKQAGAIPIHKSPKEVAVVGNEAIERFASLVRADEREACAKFVEDVYVRQFKNPWREDLAVAIRARGETSLRGNT